jgi:4-carboxymuconolactone decarboxylase
MIAGLPTDFDNPRQQVVYGVSSALLAPRVVPAGLYRRAVSLMGHEGLTDLTVLLDFTGVSLSLMAYDVPSTAIGLQH